MEPSRPWSWLQGLLDWSLGVSQDCSHPLLMLLALPAVPAQQLIRLAMQELRATQALGEFQARKGSGV